MTTDPLTSINADTEVLVDHITASPSDRVRLQRLGICDGRRILVAQTGDPLIVMAVGTRIGVSRRLAEKVVVRRP